MKTIYVILLGFIFFQHPVSAQAPAAKPSKGAILAALNLNADQQKQLQALRQDTKAAKQQNAISFANDKKALHEANRQLRLNTETKMKTILTPDQWQKWQSMKAQKHQERMQSRLNEMATYLQLTEDQKKTVFDLTVNRNNKIKENKTMYGSQPDALHRANKETNQAYRAQMAKILSPAQMDKLKTWRKEHKKH